MKKILFTLLFISFLTTTFAMQGDFSSCAENIDKVYEEKNKNLEDIYNDIIANLTFKKDVATKEAFHFFKLKNSLQKIQEIRSYYQKNINESEIAYKKQLSEAKEEHDFNLKICLLEKRNFDYKEEIREIR